MLVLKNFNFLLVLLLTVVIFSISNGMHDDSKFLRDEDKRGLTSQTKGKSSPTKELTSSKARTLRNGIFSTSNNKRNFGLDALSPPGYGGSGGGYPYSGSGDDRSPSYYDSDGRYPESGSSGYGRPSSYGSGYGSYPPRGPVYDQRPYDDTYYQGQSGGGNQELSKMLNFKKILLPLAGLAILGVAAAASQNPVLMPLGAFSGRRKRSIWPPNVYPPNPKVKPKN